MAANGTVRGKAVMVVGATGALGSKTCRALLDQDVGVRALVRASSNRETLKALGVSDFVIGDMMDPASLAAAFSQHPVPDAVVASAAGYTRRSKGDTSDTDRRGYENLVDATKDVKRR
jgi:nucleoside-diphosphate-sugar epimerase